MCGLPQDTALMLRPIACPPFVFSQTLQLASPAEMRMHPYSQAVLLTEAGATPSARGFAGDQANAADDTTAEALNVDSCIFLCCAPSCQCCC